MTVWLFRAGKQGEFENKFLEDGRSVALRPYRSAYRPMIRLPSGRIRKPMAKIPAVFNNWTVWFPSGKNSDEK